MVITIPMFKNNPNRHVMTYREIRLDGVTESIASIIPKLDCLVVLGKGIGADGVLTPASQYRTEVAAAIIQQSQPMQVIFTGGHSWQQELSGEVTPSEGSTMLAYVKILIGAEKMQNKASMLLCENASYSTVENFINVKPILLNNGNDAVIGVLSNDWHFSQGRIRYLTSITYPQVRETVGIVLPEISLLHPSQLKEERLVNLATRMMMLGIRKGDSATILHRQRILEAINRSIRQLSAPRR